MTYSIDTLAAAAELKEAGFNEKQAESIAKVIGKQDEGLVTKTYLDAAIAELKVEIGNSKIFLLTTMIGLAGIIIAAIKLL